MNTQREVFNKLFKEEKTELATQKVELALVDDFNSRIDKANNFRSVASGNYNRALLDMESASIQMDLAVKEGEKIEKASKDLGVKSPIKISSVKQKASEFSKIVNFLKKGKISRS
jgi:hypothetical protein